MDRYKELIKSLHCKPKTEEILGSFLFTFPQPTLISSPVPPPKNKKNVPPKKSETPDIRQMFNANQRGRTY